MGVFALTRHEVAHAPPCCAPMLLEWKIRHACFIHKHTSAAKSPEEENMHQRAADLTIESLSLVWWTVPEMQFCPVVWQRQDSNTTKPHETALPRDHRQGRSRKHLTQRLWKLMDAQRPSPTHSDSKVSCEKTALAHPMSGKSCMQ